MSLAMTEPERLPRLADAGGGYRDARNGMAAVAVPVTEPGVWQPRPVLVVAAASLKTALDQTAGGWRRDTGRQVTISYAASSVLAKQIENGAPADLFISADEDWMDYLQQSRLI